METINMHEAKTRLSNLVEQALAGKDVVIAKAGTPLVRLVPVGRAAANRQPGRYKNKVHMAPDFDHTPQDVIRSFEDA
ncbi:type II toxin-antitoxin system Phd/YefM family antitoxin [Sulfurivermis fontis]|uniref:type II toxin-antitoxin system Phd/YefM family antitoxin n=1 Tax=Sulfurivermis fontis TaxID=1972068 RepID=UPI000FDBE5BF|nr:type II toxin-antitoxin system prevent-host-death family antitoxin [Sulfurivermis fontis]